MITALEFGSRHRSCSEAMEWRRSLPTDATQADAWLACERGDWLLWQLSHGLDAAQYDAARPAIKRALDRITERAVLRAHLACVEAGIEIPEWEVWAFDFVTNPAAEAAAAESVAESVAAAEEASAEEAAAAAASARAAERLAQAEDIRAEIPAWIWEEVPRGE